MIQDIHHKVKKLYTFLNITLIISILLLFVFSLTVGKEVYSINTVIQVLHGKFIQGATFTIQTLRFPRALAAIFCGFAFGISGSFFQSLLKNPLASPDMIGISSGASVCAVFTLLVLHISGIFVGISAILGAMIVAFTIYFLSMYGGFKRSKMILLGIGIQVFLQALLSWLLLVASEYEIQTAMQWLSGSLNGVVIDHLYPLIAIVVISIVLTFLYGDAFNLLELGDDMAIGLGVSRKNIQALFIMLGLFCVAIATSISGPMSSIAFLSGPIAKKIIPAHKESYLLAGLIGSLLLLMADWLGQYAFSTRYPAGIITSLLGAPYLLHLLIRLNQKGGD